MNQEITYKYFAADIYPNGNAILMGIYKPHLNATINLSFISGSEPISQCFPLNPEVQINSKTSFTIKIVNFENGIYSYVLVISTPQHDESIFDQTTYNTELYQNYIYTGQFSESKKSFTCDLFKSKLLIGFKIIHICKLYNIGDFILFDARGKAHIVTKETIQTAHEITPIDGKVLYSVAYGNTKPNEEFMFVALTDKIEKNHGCLDPIIFATIAIQNSSGTFIVNKLASYSSILYLIPKIKPTNIKYLTISSFHKQFYMIAFFKRDQICLASVPKETIEDIKSKPKFKTNLLDSTALPNRRILVLNFINNETLMAICHTGEILVWQIDQNYKLIKKFDNKCITEIIPQEVLEKIIGHAIATDPMSAISIRSVNKQFYQATAAAVTHQNLVHDHAHLILTKEIILPNKSPFTCRFSFFNDLLLIVYQNEINNNIELQIRSFPYGDDNILYIITFAPKPITYTHVKLFKNYVVGISNKFIIFQININNSIINKSILEKITETSEMPITIENATYYTEVIQNFLFIAGTGFNNSQTTACFTAIDLKEKNHKNYNVALPGMCRPNLANFRQTDKYTVRIDLLFNFQQQMKLFYFNLLSKEFTAPPFPGSYPFYQNTKLCPLCKKDIGDLSENDQIYYFPSSEYYEVKVQFISKHECNGKAFNGMIFVHYGYQPNSYNWYYQANTYENKDYSPVAVFLDVNSKIKLAVVKEDEEYENVYMLDIFGCNDCPNIFAPIPKEYSEPPGKKRKTSPAT
jgi:hypothetical protein